MSKFIKWCKSEIVLVIAVVLAAISSCIILPDKEYIDYIDFGTLALLFCLMAVMAGLQKIGVFRLVAQKLLQKVTHIRGVVFVLVMLCFFSSMLITNDVALITFVPFTFIVLRMVLGENSTGVLVPVVVMQTIAANLGSMLTPIGNPQNLYLYGKSAMGVLAFIKLMLPYTIIAFVVLTGWCMLFPYKGEKRLSLSIEEPVNVGAHKKQLVIYGMLFLLCILTVAHVVPHGVTFVAVLAVVFLMDKKVLGKVDYALLVTFVGFFIFIGNMGRIPVFKELLERIIDGNEVLTSVVASQFMSNVPAAILLSGFTYKYNLLIVGTNLGGLGTLIASMASLISFKFVGKEYAKLKGKYLLYFTVSNLLFLILLFGYTLL